MVAAQGHLAANLRSHPHARPPARRAAPARPDRRRHPPRPSPCRSKERAPARHRAAALGQDRRHHHPRPTRSHGPGRLHLGTHRRSRPDDHPPPGAWRGLPVGSVQPVRRHRLLRPDPRMQGLGACPARRALVHRGGQPLNRRLAGLLQRGGREPARATHLRRRVAAQRLHRQRVRLAGAQGPQRRHQPP